MGATLHGKTSNGEPWHMECKSITIDYDKKRRDRWLIGDQSVWVMDRERLDELEVTSVVDKVYVVIHQNMIIKVTIFVIRVEVDNLWRLLVYVLSDCTDKIAGAIFQGLGKRIPLEDATKILEVKWSMDVAGMSLDSLRNFDSLGTSIKFNSSRLHLAIGWDYMFDGPLD